MDPPARENHFRLEPRRGFHIQLPSKTARPSYTVNPRSFILNRSIINDQHLNLSANHTAGSQPTYF